MKILIPHIKGITDRWENDSRIEYYQAIKFSELQGGKEPRIIGDTALSFESIKALVERLGPRFRVLANTCYPTWSRRVYDLCDLLSANEGHIVLSRMDFAGMVKSSYPKIKLHSSVIMNFYEPLHKILESPLFETVGGSQFYNNDTDKMIELVPEQHRKRLIYLLKGCVWSPKCIRHYELPSLQYKYPQIIKEVFQDKDCTGKPGFKVNYEKLLDAGFDIFKFGYRTPTLEQAEAVLEEYLNRYETWKNQHISIGGSI